ncbi:MAG: hypothetical protein CW691_11195 [Candidatus Bathyarchaeum sp.]|nr:MAG: hypothetical protein CW691_11195 [Candidatus Bathyarchaeum sp.]
MLKEYIINAEFWKHHDAMRQKKMENFLTVNSIFAAAIALLTSSIFSNMQTVSIILIIGISIIGFFVSVTWNSVMRRNSEYMRFQRLQLCSIEKVLPDGFMTFTKMYKAFDKPEAVDFSCTKKPFITKTESANKLEGALPIIIAVSWFVIATGCAAFLFHMFTF